ncbi:integral inner membrane protein [Fictibacillus macauensis ZFHKF-1]|uniref:Integral inner membrane protein n=1 Tax=Fictibacillus macauensis ZFHKF-1 TaxID=1196324 RepID=I8UBW1_9BACL|nr:VanZ family protein [Fictibacillus macauensis]EIT84283.1 integral inner membrane protein [Fictibacillus macauensis ZFHKF-1]
MNTKKLIVILWITALSVPLFTTNLEALANGQGVHFSWQGTPVWLSFFNMNDLTDIHPYFVVVKLGHFLGFAILDLCLLLSFRNHRTAFIFSFSFAVTSEILQLFMGRDGRLYDVAIDTFGIVAMIIFVKGISFLRNTAKEQHRTT